MPGMRTSSTITPMLWRSNPLMKACGSAQVCTRRPTVPISKARLARTASSSSIRWISGDSGCGVVVSGAVFIGAFVVRAVARVWRFDCRCQGASGKLRQNSAPRGTRL